MMLGCTPAYRSPELARLFKVLEGTGKPNKRLDEDAWLWDKLEKECGADQPEAMYTKLKTERIESDDDKHQFEGRLIPETSDNWAAGLTIVEMFAGSREWPAGKGEKAAAAADKHLARIQGAENWDSARVLEWLAQQEAADEETKPKKRLDSLNLQSKFEALGESANGAWLLGLTPSDAAVQFGLTTPRGKPSVSKQKVFANNLQEPLECYAMPDELRKILPRVFAEDAKERPTTDEVLAVLEAAAAEFVPGAASVMEASQHSTEVASRILFNLSRAFDSSGDVVSAADTCAEWWFRRQQDGVDGSEERKHGGKEQERDRPWQRLLELYRRRDGGVEKVNLSTEPAYRKHWRTVTPVELDEIFVALGHGKSMCTRFDLHKSAVAGESTH